MQTLRKKTHKGRLSFVINPLQTIWKGKYAGVALENARITENQIKAAELAIKRTIKKNGELWIRINPNISVSSKPAEVRMGKGKGNFSHFIARVKTGSIIFELDTFQNSINPGNTATLITPVPSPIPQGFSAIPFFEGDTNKAGRSVSGDEGLLPTIGSRKGGEDLLARQAFKVAASKLPLKLRFIKLDN